MENIEDHCPSDSKMFVFNEHLYTGPGVETGDLLTRLVETGSLWIVTGTFNNHISGTFQLVSGNIDSRAECSGTGILWYWE